MWLPVNQGNRSRDGCIPEPARTRRPHPPAAFTTYPVSTHNYPPELEILRLYRHHHSCFLPLHRVCTRVKPEPVPESPGSLLRRRVPGQVRLRYGKYSRNAFAVAISCITFTSASLPGP